LTKIDAVSVFVVGDFSTDSGVMEIYDDVTGYRNLVGINGNGNLRYSTDTDNEQQCGFLGCSGGLEFVTGSGSSGVYSAIHSGENVELSSGGTISNGALDAADRANSFVIGDDQGGGDQDRPQQSGSIAEVIVYNKALNAAHRTIVENHLAAKYGQSLSGEVYASSTYTQDVFGIGRESASAYHQEAQSGGMRLTSKTGLDDGDYLLAGHNVENNSLDSSDVGGLGPHPARSSRVWYVDKTDSGSGLVVDITFDLSKMGLAGQVTSTEDYALIRSSSSGPFSWSEVREKADAVGNGDQITFRGVNLNDGEYYTVMTEDQTESELDSPALVIRGTEGNEAPGGINGGAGADAGWRMLGVPVSGATAGDLHSLRDPTLVEFWVNGMFYRRNSKTNWETITQSQTPLVNGRGYLLYLFDNEDPNLEPIDPTLTIDVNGGSEIGDQNVTVGDETPTADKPLNTDSTWHYLANPYAKSFNLTDLNLSKDADADSTSDFGGIVQVWDPMAGNGTGSYVLLQPPRPFDSPADYTVAPWQAFFVERIDYDSGAAKTLTFNKAGRTTGTSFIGSKSGSSAQDTREIGLRVEAYDHAGNVQAEDKAAGVFFHPDAEKGQDFYDASKLEPFSGAYVALAPVGSEGGDDVLRAQESLPYSLTGAVEIPLELQVENLKPSGMELSVPEWTNIPEEWTVTLVDTKGTADESDDEQATLGAGSSYAFSPVDSKMNEPAGAVATKGKASESITGAVPKVRTLTSKNAGVANSKSASEKETDPSRFILRVDPGEGALPVEMAGINAQTDAESVVLNWSTASETNNAGFYVEHQRLPQDTSASPRAVKWTRKGFVEGTGTTESPQDYQYRLRDLEYGRHAFRLRQVDTDGGTAYSRVVESEVRLGEDHAVKAPYPNPVHRQATLEVTVREKQPIQVQMYDVLGRRVRTLYAKEMEGQQTRQIQIRTEDLSSGVYFVRVKGKGFAETRRMTVVR
jgi:hypothetical protein